MTSAAEGTHGGQSAATQRRWPLAPRQIVRRAAVLGAGTMGSQIAAHIANQGVPCDLLDLAADLAGSDGGAPKTRSHMADEAKKRLLERRPAPVYSPDVLDLIRPGNFSDDLSRLSEADWVIEAVTERLDIKRDLWASVAPYLRPDVIASSNTSGLPISSIAEALPETLRGRFLGIHFFNPPRYLRVLEVIPTQQTDEAVVDAVRRFAEHILGKSVVIAHDVPNFITNRIGCYGLTSILRAMEEFGLAPDEVDSISGPVMGRPNSATFRTLDLVGLDVFVDICDNTRGYVSEPWERDAFDVPPYLREMVDRGWIGEKAGQGFYKRVQEGSVGRQILALDLDSFEYRPRRRADSATLEAVTGVEDTGDRLRRLVGGDDPAARFAWRALSELLVYSALMVGEVADDIASIDRAMRLGFGWELGPFESWDALGVAGTAGRMRDDGLDVPAWVTEVAERGEHFYRHEAEHSLQARPGAKHAPVPEPERVLSLERVRAATERIVVERPGASLYDLSDGVAFLDLHSPRQTIGADVIDLLEESAERVPLDFRGLVVGSRVPPNFCAGVDLLPISTAAKEGRWDEIDALLRRYQDSLLGLKRLPVPVVAAPYGMTLGGGVELLLAADRVVASVESYIGQVEVGAGVVPTGGGCKEMLLRSLRALLGGLEGVAGGGRGAPKIFPDPDPDSALSRVFETIGLAKVSDNALEARELGFVGAADVVVPNLDHLVYVAKEAVVALDQQGYAPPEPAQLPVLGEGSRALLELNAQHLVWGDYASEHDMTIARKLAYVLTGGDGPAGSMVGEQHFLDLEREAFLSLCGEPKTIARMEAFAKTGKPLRS